MNHQLSELSDEQLADELHLSLTALGCRRSWEDPYTWAVTVEIVHRKWKREGFDWDNYVDYCNSKPGYYFDTNVKIGDETYLEYTPLIKSGDAVFDVAFTRAGELLIGHVSVWLKKGVPSLWRDN